MAAETTATLTTEQLKDLLAGCGVTNTLGYSEDLERLRDIAPTLAAEVVRLREAPRMIAACGDYGSGPDMADIARQALSQK